MDRSADVIPLRVSDTELQQMLERTISRTSGQERRIVQMARRFSDYQSSFAIEELAIRFEDGTNLPLIFKNLSPGAMLEGAQVAKPNFVRNPLREIEMYRVLLTPCALGTPKLYGHVADQRHEKFWLFLEQITGLELYQVGELTVWETVARWLGGMHRCFSQMVDVSTTVPLLQHDEAFYRRWLERALTFHAKDPEVNRDLQWLANRYDRILDRVTALPRTIIHGEFYASNVLVVPSHSLQRVCPVDWEMAAVGPGLIDLAALTAGNWTEQESRALAFAYREGLQQKTEAQLSDREFLEALAACRVCMAVQWLGWAPNWSPPSEHRQDWLGEALNQAEGL